MKDHQFGWPCACEFNDNNKQIRACPDHAALADWARVMETALEEIAADQNVYKGHGNFDTTPRLNAAEAQTLARATLASKVV